MSERKSPTRRRMLGTAFALLALLPLSASAQKSPMRPETPVRFEIAAKSLPSFDPREPNKTRFGQLIYRGGIQLTSSYKEFGEISSMRVQPDGANFIAVTDKGRWLRGRIAYDGTRPTGIADAEMAPILGPDGRTLAARGWYDTESIAQDGGTLWLGIERVHRIVRFDYGRHGLLARGQPMATPPGMAKLPANKSLECLTFVPREMPLGGTLVAISESGLDADGNIKSFLIGGQTPGDFTVKRTDDYDVTDCAILPSQELLLLERRFLWTSGVGMRLRRIPLAQVKPGAVIDGPVVMEAGMAHQIDNMEGLSVHRAPDGAIVLTLVSDDNFAIIQRTILLQFTLAE